MLYRVPNPDGISGQGGRGRPPTNLGQREGKAGRGGDRWDKRVRPERTRKGIERKQFRRKCLLSSPAVYKRY